MGNTIPPTTRRGSVDVRDIRHFVMDRTPLDNPLLLDLDFSDAEIFDAMHYAAISYNAMEPKVDLVDEFAFPAGAEMIFITGTVYHLYLTRLQGLARNNVEYQAGNMTVDINAKRIEFFAKQAESFKADFNRLAADRKRTINIEGFYRAF